MKATRSSIICATDFSVRATEAATVAAKLALRRSEKLLLVHIVETAAAKASAALKVRVDGEAERLRGLGAEVEALVLHSRQPHAAMLTCIREHGPSLVVVGAGIKAPLDRWALGSFSERVAQSSPVPTLVVRNPTAFEAWDWAKSRLTVLLALDFSPSSDVVLRWSRKFQSVGPCDFIACHANFRTSAGIEPGAPFRNPDTLQVRLENRLRKKVRNQTGNDAMPIVVRATFGDTGPAVTEIAEEHRAHLIAVGTHQRHGVHRLAQFSVSRDILHQASANVICVPVTTKFDAREAHIPEFRRVLVTTDFSELGNTAVPYACAACASSGAVKIVHVVSARKAARQGISLTSELRAQLRELIPEEVGVRAQSTEVQLVKGDDVARAICEEAERFDADVVCLASHGMGLSRALHGSVAKAVLQRIRRPVLVVRRPD